MRVYGSIWYYLVVSETFSRFLVVPANIWYFMVISGIIHDLGVSGTFSGHMDGDYS